MCNGLAKHDSEDDCSKRSYDGQPPQQHLLLVQQQWSQQQQLQQHQIHSACIEEQTGAHVWVKLDSSKSDGQSRVCEISGDTRESVNKANKLDQELVDTCSTQSGCGQTGPVFSSEANKEAEQTVVMVRLSEENHPDSTADEAAWRQFGQPVKKRQQLFRRTLKLAWTHLSWRPQSTPQRWNITRP